MLGRELGGNSEVTSIESLKIWQLLFQGKQIEYAILFDRDHPKVMGEEERPRKAAANEAMIAFVCHSLGRLGQPLVICIKVDDDGAMEDDNDTPPSERIPQNCADERQLSWLFYTTRFEHVAFSNSTMNHPSLAGPANSGSIFSMANPIFSTTNVKSDSLSQPVTSPFGPTPTNRAHEPVAPSSSSSPFPLFSRFPGSHTQQGPVKGLFTGG
jgi:hypothetical protein